MQNNYLKYAGSFLFIGAVQFLIFLIVAEAVYPGYSISENMISDLGVGISAKIFNSSVILFGAFVALAAYYLFKEYDDKIFFLVLAIAGLGAIGVGFFPETTGIPHFVSALLAFLFGATGAIYSKNKVNGPLSVFCIILGVISFIALILTIFNIYLGIGPGGMERMIVYPILAWCLVFSGFLFLKTRK
ncbi:MAG: DUF998 domain-containing protein [Candidatus Micrarchaeia archaeon]